MTGIWLVSSCDLSFLHRANPSMPGIMTSDTMRSTACALSCFRASNPFSAVSTRYFVANIFSIISNSCMLSSTRRMEGRSFSVSPASEDSSCTTGEEASGAVTSGTDISASTGCASGRFCTRAADGATHGRVTVKRLPLPGSLSNVRLPWCKAVNSRASASPMPFDCPLRPLLPV